MRNKKEHFGGMPATTRWNGFSQAFKLEKIAFGLTVTVKFEALPEGKIKMILKSLILSRSP